MTAIKNQSQLNFLLNTNMTYKTTVPELELRMKKSVVHKAKIESSTDSAKFFREAMDHETIEVQEQFFVVYLNAANKTIGWVRISSGGITSCTADPILIIKYAIDCLASGMILCHNHPSGRKEPSGADIQITKKIKGAAEFLNIRVLDHVIITADDHYSFADEGLI